MGALAGQSNIMARNQNPGSSKSGFMPDTEMAWLSISAGTYRIAGLTCVQGCSQKKILTEAMSMNNL